MSDNLIARLIPHQGCVITPKGDAVEIASAARDWVMAAAVAPLICRAPFVFRVVGKTDSTNLRMHWHSGELIFNWECSVRELRVHDPATNEQHGLKNKGFLTTGDWHEITWEIRLDGMRVTVDGGSKARVTIPASKPRLRSARALAAPSMFASSGSRRWRNCLRSLTASASSLARRSNSGPIAVFMAGRSAFTTRSGTSP